VNFDKRRYPQANE